MGALTLLMGMSMTSCLDDESNVGVGAALTRLTTNFYGGVTFTTNDGRTVTPSSESIIKMESNNGIDLSDYNNQVVYIYYQWNKDKINVPEDATAIEGVDLNYMELLDSPVEVVHTKGAANDSIENTPIRSIGVKDGYTTIEPAYFDRTTLILPIDYYLATYEHSFTLVYYPEEDEASDSMTFYLRHNKQKDTPTTGSTQAAVAGTYGAIGVFWRAFDLSEAMTTHAMKHSLPLTSYPSQIKIKTKESDNTVNIEDSQVKENEYTITYSSSSSSINLSTISRRP